MLFNSVTFLFFYAVVFVCYYLPIGKSSNKIWQVTLLLVASAFFYGWEDPRLLILLGLSCAGNCFAVITLIRNKLQGNEGRVKQIVIFSVAANLLLLAVFKYAGFLAHLVPGLSQETLKFFAGIPLPIGISFYTFHGISMIVDVARGQVKQENLQSIESRGFLEGFRDTGLYLLFFPQLVAGPIVKAKEFWPQIDGKRFSDIPWKKAMRCLILGYFLKIFVADNLAEQTAVLAMGADRVAPLSFGQVVPLLYCYSFQIFADFAGYSLIAIGLASTFGYTLPINFNFPYLTTSVTEFWRRWHISLSSWLRDYLYIPLGGNRKGELRTYLNLFLVMFLGGLWHGAEWKFAVWGSLHGLIIALEKWCSSKWTLRIHFLPKSWLTSIKWFYTFHVVTLLWLTFLMPDLDSILAFGHAASHFGKWSGPALFSLLFFGGVVCLYHLWGAIKGRVSVISRFLLHPFAEGALLGIMLYLIVTNPGAPRGFIYFQF